jgi:hypothetical protein
MRGVRPRRVHFELALAQNGLERERWAFHFSEGWSNWEHA